MVVGCFTPAMGHSSWGNGTKHLPTPNWKPQQTKVKIPQKSNSVDQWVLFGSLTGMWVRGHLQEQKWLKVSCLTKCQHGWQLTKTENLEHTAQSAGSSKAQRFSLPGNSGSLSLFHVPKLAGPFLFPYQAGLYHFLLLHLISASSGCLLVLCESVLLIMYTWWGRGLVNSVSFSNFLKLLSCSFPEFY